MTARSVERASSEHGSVLLMTLWGVSILSLLAIGAGYQAMVEARLVSYQIDRASERRLCLSASELMRLPEGARRLNSADGAIVLSDPQPEEEKIDLNRAPLKALQSVTGLNAETAAAIVDWRDGDDEMSSGSAPGGAENAFYQALSVPYPCKNAPFESLEELLMVRGFTPDLLSTIRPFVTVYGENHVRVRAAVSDPRGRAANYEILLRRVPPNDESSPDRWIIRGLARL